MAMMKLKRDQAPEAPAAAPRSLTPIPPKKKQRSDRGSGCRIVVLLFLLIIVGAVVGAYQFRELYTTTTPGALHVPRTRQAVLENAQQKVEALRTGVTLNAVLTVSFSEAELNALLQQALEESGWSGQMVASLSDKIELNYTLPVGGVPWFNGRHVTGSATFDISVDNGTPTVEWVKGTMNGRNIPAFVRHRLGGRKLAEKILSIPRLEAMTDHIATLRIDDGTMRIVTRQVNTP